MKETAHIILADPLAENFQWGTMNPMLFGSKILSSYQQKSIFECIC